MMRTRVPTSWIVPALFAVAAATTGVSAGDNLSRAIIHSGSRTWLVALYSMLRTAVALAFAVCSVGRAAPRRPARSPLAFLACAAALAATIGFGEPGASTPDGLIVAGELTAVAFAVWLLVSILFLGRCFGILPEARGLVTRGPYRIIRHPVYLGEIGACAGLAIAAPSVRNATAVLTVLLAQVVRMRLEERALTEAFPSYAAYARATPRLLPRVHLDFRLARPSASSVVVGQTDR
jgi:protein-S-isoprenylcysteine O-methyltransferase Ste14